MSVTRDVTAIQRGSFVRTLWITILRMKNDGISFHEAHLPRLWLMTNIANELHSSWKLLCFLQTSTTISQLSNETKASFTRNYQHNSGLGEKSKLSMRQKDGMQTMFEEERAKIKTRLYKFIRGNRDDDEARNGIRLRRIWRSLVGEVSLSIRPENGQRKKYHFRSWKRENQCKPVLTSWPSLSLCPQTFIFISSRYKSYSTGEKLPRT